MSEAIKIDGNDPEWEQKCWQNAESKNLFDLINLTKQAADETLPACHSIALKYGYELKAKIPSEGSGTCHFIPRNYDTTKTKITSDFVFSGSPDD